MLCELETDKVTSKCPAPSLAFWPRSGLRRRNGRCCSACWPRSPKGRTAAPAAPAAAESSSVLHRGSAHSTILKMRPSAKKAMAETGLSRPLTVTGTGRDGRVMKEDVGRARGSKPSHRQHPQRQPAPRAPRSADDAAREERVKMTRSAPDHRPPPQRSQNTAAMLTTYNEVDMTAVMELRKHIKTCFRKEHGVKWALCPFSSKACCHALREVPEVNAEIDGTDVSIKTSSIWASLLARQPGLLCLWSATPTDVVCCDRKSHRRNGPAGARR